MAGLLDFLNTPAGIGLLSAAAGGMAGARRGQPWNTAGRGLSTGLLGYAEAQKAQEAKAKEEQAKQARLSAFQSATVAPQQAKPAMFGIGGMQGSQDAMGMVASQNRDINALSAMPDMSRPVLPQGNGVETLPMRGAPRPVPQSLMQPRGEAALQMAANQEQGAPEMPAEQLPEQVQQTQAAQEAQAGGFDFGKFAQAAISDPNAPPEMQELAMKYFASQKEAKAPKWNVVERYNEQTGRKEKVMMNEADPTSVMPFGGQEAPDPVKQVQVGQDMRDWLMSNGVNPQDATPEQFKAAYTATTQEKLTRAKATGVNIGPTRVENITTQESEGSKVYGKGLGEMQVDIQKQGFAAPIKIANLDRMSQLLAGVDSGRFSGAGMEAARFAKSFGFNVDPKLGNKQAAEALAIEMALAMREPGSGPMTDKDFNNYLNTVPSLAKTAAGRREITATLKAKAKRDIQISKAAREYAKQNRGVIDDNFLDQVAEHMARNPVIPVNSTGGGGWSMKKVK